MSIRKLPEIQAKQSKNISFDLREDALAHWQPEKCAAATNADTLELYGIVGDDWSDTPITAHAVAEFLQGKQDITVSINSAGGSYFEGIAIYNLLRAHPHKITVQVIGDAASAASVIAMAGDEILMGEGTFMMIHNCWGYVIGNRQDLAQSIELMAEIDSAMADLYTAQTGKDKAEIIKMMDDETWLNAENAIEQGFATGKLPEKVATEPDPNQAQRKAKAQIESALRAQGFSRGQSREILKNYKTAPMSRAGSGLNSVKPRADYSQILEQLNSLEH
ncbi:head maturation protease, ClpP-related [Wielerella bovis]|uniref:head maturation protease, ClpP-related n=1 Tax=Wielerella bovis TaxID=2917790 RepID=UPI002018A9F3|nr:head maturation protease, ClpP-related [Wielerella bovis]ULJ67897.1 Clp protease ClpP [Wielerella bovis]